MATILTDRGHRELQSNTQADDGRELFGFWDTVEAGFGFTLDEGLSVSGVFSRQGWEDRVNILQEMRDSGEVGKDEFLNRRHQTDWAAASAKFPERIKTDEALELERKEIYAKKRAHKDMVYAGSDSTAGNLFGEGAAYMIDPPNLATMFVSAPFQAVRGLGFLRNAFRIGSRTAALTATSEMFIQSIVTDFKADIDSPYSTREAIAAVGMTAAGGFIIGGITGGVRGYLGRIRSDALKSHFPDGESAAEAKKALDSLSRLESSLEGTPVLSEAQVGVEVAREIDSIVNVMRVELLEDSSAKLSRGDRKSLEEFIADFEHKLQNVDSSPEAVVSTRGKPARKAKRESIELGKELARRTSNAIEDALESARTRLKASKVGERAEADMSRVAQGIIPDRIKEAVDSLSRRFEGVDVERLVRLSLTDDVAYQRAIAEVTHMKQIRMDVDNLEKLAKIREDGDSMFKPAEVEFKDNPNFDQIKEDDGLYDEVMAAYSKMEKPKMVLGKEMADTDKIMKELDDLKNALESIRACSIG